VQSTQYSIILSSGYLSPDARKRMNGSVEFIPTPIDEAAQIAMVQPRPRHLKRGRITSNHIAALNFFLIRYENRLI